MITKFGPQASYKNQKAVKTPQDTEVVLITEGILMVKSVTIDEKVSINK